MGNLQTRVADLGQNMSTAFKRLLHVIRRHDTTWLAAWLRWFIVAVACFQQLAWPLLWGFKPSSQRGRVLMILAAYSIFAAIFSIMTKRLSRIPKDDTLERPNGNSKRIWYFYQLICDTMFISILNVYSGSYHSNTFLFYILPLLAAAYNFNEGRSVVAFIAIVGAFSSTFIFIDLDMKKATTGEDSLLRSGIEQALSGALGSGTFFMAIIFAALFWMRIRRDHLRANNSQLEAINTTANKIAEGEALRLRLQVITGEATKLLNARGCKLYLKEREQLQLVAITGLESYRIEPSRLKSVRKLSIDQGLAGMVARTKLPFFTNDYPHSKYAVDDFRNIFEAVVEVPLTFRGEVIGVLGVFDNKERRPFEQADVELLEKLAVHAAVAIHDAQIIEYENLQKKAWAALNHACKAINEKLDPKETLKAIAEHSWRITSVYSPNPVCSEIWLRKDDDTLTFDVAWPVKEGKKIRRKVSRVDLSGRIAPRKGVVGRVALSGKYEVVKDAQSDPDYICVHDETVTLFVLPIHAHNEIFGVFNIEHSKEHAFPDNLVEIMKIFASQAAAAISNAIVYERIKLLHTCENKINEARGPQEVADEILKQLKVIFPYTRATLQRIQGDERSIFAENGKIPKKYDNYLTRPVSEDRLITRILHEDKACIALPKDIPEWEENDVTAGTKLWVGIPMTYRGETVGFLTADRVTSERHDNHQKQLLHIFGKYSASTLQNAFLLQELQEQFTQLESLSEHLADQSNLALIGLVYGETIHFARAKLGMARVCAADISQGFYDGDLDRLKQAAIRIRELLADYLEALKRVQAQALKAPQIVAADIHNTLEKALGAKKIFKRDIKVMREYAAPQPVVHAPERQLRQVFLVILENALVAMRNEGTLTLHTSALDGAQATMVEVAISDTGRGIPDSQLSDLFKRKKTEDSNGAGIGLMWAYAFMRSIGGTIKCESRLGAGTTMRVQIPQDFRLNVVRENMLTIEELQNHAPD